MDKHDKQTKPATSSRGSSGNFNGIPYFEFHWDHSSDDDYCTWNDPNRKATIRFFTDGTFIFQSWIFAKKVLRSRRSELGLLVNLSPPGPAGSPVYLGNYNDNGFECYKSPIMDTAGKWYDFHVSDSVPAGTVPDIYKITGLDARMQS